MTFTAVMAAQMVANWHLPIFVGLIVAILTGILCGGTSGFMVAKLKLPPFIATLGMNKFTKGLSLILAHSKPIYFTDAPTFSQISMGSVLNFSEEFQIPNAVIIFILVAIIAG